MNARSAAFEFTSCYNGTAAAASYCYCYAGVAVLLLTGVAVTGEGW
jgi:hypothetical protein